MDYDDDNEYDAEEFDEENEEDESNSGWVYKASYVVVAIDTHPTMFQIDSNGRLPFRNCLEACLRVLDSLIFVKNRREWNPFAVLLAREDHKFIDFGDNILESIKLLKSKVKLSDQELANEFQRKGDFDLAEFFLQCKKVFHDIKAAFYKRIFLYITNDDSPTKDAQARFAALNEVKSFDASQIRFEVIPTDVAFDFTCLYNEMFSLLDTDSEFERKEEFCTDLEGLEQKLSSIVVPKYHKTKVRFYPCKDDIKRYITCFDLKLIGSKTFLNTKVSYDGKKVIPKPAQLDEEVSYKYKIKRSKGCRDVIFESYEKDQLYDLSFQRGFTLIYISKPVMETGYCFSKPRTLQVDYQEKTDAEYFEKFWQYCVDHDRVMVCVAKYKQPGTLSYVQMSPILLGDVQTFLVKSIPFGNNFVPIPQPDKALAYEPDPKREQLVRDLVNKLTIDFHPEMIPNQKYRKKLDYVKSKLLDEPCEFEGKLFDKSSLDKRIENEVQMIKTSFDLMAKEKKKRPAAPASVNGKKRK